MASFVDLLSSPDPLVEEDEGPSSVRPPTARSTVKPMSRRRQSFYESVQSGSSWNSPKKQMFELDIGVGEQPQKILVTVEADDERRRSGISRRLFSPSPSRSQSRNGKRRPEPITTTTTTTRVPLRGLTDDEENMPSPDTTTPRRRGRPPGSKNKKSNGTPVPKGRKRLGTPLRKTPAAKRLRAHLAPESEAHSHTPMADELDEDAYTPKSRPVTRKSTPKRGKMGTPATLASKSTTGKRGRRRKASTPADAANSDNADDALDAHPVPSDMDLLRSEPEPQPAGGIPQQEADMDMLSEEGGKERMAQDGDDGPTDMSPSRQESDQKVRSEDPRRHPAVAAPLSELLDSLPEDYPMDAYMAEPHSDMDTDGEGKGVQDTPHSGEDTLAHASDFSMIAVESLPSFQASFHESHSHGDELQIDDDLVDEANLIINKTLGYVREGLHEQSPERQTGAKDQDNRFAPKSPAQKTPSPQSRPRATRRRSPVRRLAKSKKTPAPSHQVVGSASDKAEQSQLAGAAKQQSPSALPSERNDPSKPSSAEADPSPSSGDSRSSEEREEVLEEAPLRHSAHSAEHLGGEAHSSRTSSKDNGPLADRSTESFHSSRLPTPDDTNTSVSGSKRARDEGSVQEAGAAGGAYGGHNYGANIETSPPVLGPSLVITKEPHHGRLDERSDKAHGREFGHSLKLPAPSRRPTLSPVVRVGRTLQSLQAAMTDRSSPEGCESSLGSPFRGLVHDESKLYSLPKSPLRNQGSASIAVGSATHSVAHRNSRDSTSQQHAPAPLTSGPRVTAGARVVQEPASIVMGTVSDPFGPAVHEQNQARPEVQGHGQSNDGIPRNSQTSNMGSAQAVDDGINRLRGGNITRPSEDPPFVYHQHMPTEAVRGSHRSAGLPTATQHMGAREAYEHGIDDETEDEPAAAADGDDHAADDKAYDTDTAEASTEDRDGWEVEDEAMTEGHNVNRDLHDDDMDIWEFEYSREEPTPPPSRGSRAELHTPRGSLERAEVHRKAPTRSPETGADTPVQGPAESEKSSSGRNMLRIPWRKPSTGVPSSNGINKSSQGDERLGLDGQPDPSRQNQSRDSDGTQGKPQPAKSRFSLATFDIMSFFSSPIARPSTKPESFATETTKEPLAGPQTLGHYVDTLTTQESPRAGRVGGFFLPHIAQIPHIPQKAFHPSSERRTDLVSPALASGPNGVAVDTRPPPSTPERVIHPSVSQKRDFTPRTGQSRNTASIFASSRENSPVRPSATAVDEASHGYGREQADISLVSNDTEYERVPPRDTPSRWDRMLSPTKSCLRSPLKPKTAGRVVEFTGSNISPTAPAPAPPRGDAGGREGSRQVGGTSQPPTASEDEENDVSPSPPPSSVSLSPTPSPAPAPRAYGPAQVSESHPQVAALSHTKWTRAHWIRLDEFLQLRRRHPVAFQQHCPMLPKEERRSFSTILGKEVSAQGEKMLLQPWHLDIVDAFRYEVGAWDEKELAKRLFALLVGEDRRRRGLVGKAGRGQPGR